MGWRPTCAAPSRTGQPRTSYSRPSKPPPYLGVGWPIVSGSGRSKRWSRTEPSRPRRPPHPHDASGVPPPDHPARRRPHRGDGAKRPRGEEVAHPRRASAEAGVIRARHPAQQASSTTATSASGTYRCRWKEMQILFRAALWALPHSCLTAYELMYRPNHAPIGLFRTPNWATHRVGSDCARCLTTMQSFWTAAWVGRTSEDPSASHRRRVGCPPIRPDFPLLDSRASASESVLPSSATSSPLRGSLPPPGHDHGVGYPRSPKSEVQASPYLGQKAPGRRR